jgi:hypothetical protein
LEDGDSGTGFDITADDGLQFTVTANDAEGNPIPTDAFSWTIRSDDGEADITASLLASALRWEATLVGSWTIEVTGLTDGGAEVVRSVEAEVTHGVAVELRAPEPEFSLFAGDHTQIEVTGIDADGNTFPQDVLWSEGLGDATDINATGGATYDYFARRAGTHVLTYEVNGVEGTWNVTVEPQTTVDRFEMTLSSTTVDQLANVTLTVTAWDAFDNQIPVPPSSTVFYSDADGTPLFQGVDSSDLNLRVVTSEEGEFWLRRPEFNRHTMRHLNLNGTNDFGASFGQARDLNGPRTHERCLPSQGRCQK